MKKPAVDRLKELDNQSIVFHQANQTMLSEGYTESEIVSALYEFSYDGKPNVKQVNEITQYYEQHPDKAQELADDLAAAHKQIIETETIQQVAADMAASRVAFGPHARAAYSVKSADHFGVPYFSTLLVLGITFFVVLANRLSTYWLYIFPLGYVVIFMLVKWLMHKHHEEP